MVSAFDQYWVNAVPFAVTVPEQVRLPVAPSRVHPVADDPPARCMDVAVFEPGPMDIVPPAPKALTTLALVLKTLTVPVAKVDRV